MSRTYRRVKRGSSFINRREVSPEQKGKVKNAFYRTVIYKDGRRVVYEYDDAYWKPFWKHNDEVVCSWIINEMSDNHSGEYNLPKSFRRTKEKKYRSITKRSLARAIQRDVAEDYAPEVLKIVDAAWSYW